jgi:AcrR family transcriptional regulator
MARRVGRPRASDPAATRKGILRAAEESFATAGYTAATTRDMAARAGVNVATLHYHFGDKRSLYRAVREESMRGDLPRLADAGPDPERLEAYLTSLFEFTARSATLSRLSLLDLLDTSAEAPVKDARLTSLERTLSALRLANAPRRAAVILALLDASLLATPGEREDAESTRKMFVAAALAAAGFA